MFKIYKKGNYLYIENTETGLLIDGAASSFELQKKTKDSDSYVIVKDGKYIHKGTELKISELQKEDGTPFTTEEFETFKEESTGFNGAGGAASTNPQIEENKVNIQVNKDAIETFEYPFDRQLQGDRGFSLDRKVIYEYVKDDGSIVLLKAAVDGSLNTPFNDSTVLAEQTGRRGKFFRFVTLDYVPNEHYAEASNIGSRWNLLTTTTWFAKVPKIRFATSDGTIRIGDRMELKSYRVTRSGVLGDIKEMSGTIEIPYKNKDFITVWTAGNRLEININEASTQELPKWYNQNAGGEGSGQNLLNVVCAGRVSEKGERIGYWGENRVDGFPFQVKKVEGLPGLYDIIHNLNKINYALIATGLNDAIVNVSAIFAKEKEARVIVTDSKDNNRDGNFSFIIYELNEF